MLLGQRKEGEEYDTGDEKLNSDDNLEMSSDGSQETIEESEGIKVIYDVISNSMKVVEEMFDY